MTTRDVTPLAGGADVPPARLDVVTGRDVTAPSQPDAPRLLRSAEVAERLGCSVRWLQQKVADGTAPHVRIGTRLRFTEADVAALIAALHVAPLDLSTARAAGRRARRSA